MEFLILAIIGGFMTQLLMLMFNGKSKYHVEHKLYRCRGEISGGSKGRAEREETETEKRITPTAEERRLQEMDLELREAVQPQLIDVSQLALALSGQLAKGGELPGFLQALPGGISEEVTSDIVGRSLEDVRTGLQASGLLDSGTRAELETRTAADIRTQAEQFNLQNLLQLLNIAVGAPAQVQQPILGFGQQLSQRLQGLRGEKVLGTRKLLAGEIGGEAGASIPGFGT